MSNPDHNLPPLALAYRLYAHELQRGRGALARTHRLLLAQGYQCSDEWLRLALRRYEAERPVLDERQQLAPLAKADCQLIESDGWYYYPPSYAQLDIIRRYRPCHDPHEDERMGDYLILLMVVLAIGTPAPFWGTPFAWCGVVLTVVWAVGIAALMWLKVVATKSG